MAKVHFDSVLDDKADAAWKLTLLKLFGRAGAAKILKIKRCKVCQGRLRPYTEPRDGSASNRAFGVKPKLRCIRCGRDG